jgi:hypothetical protein
MMYIGNNTYNIPQYSTLMVNALSTVAALTCDIQADGGEYGTSSRVSFNELEHFHGYKDTLIDERSEGFAAVERDAPEAIDRNLDVNDKFVRILSVLLGKSVMVTNVNAGQYQINSTENLFKKYRPLDPPRTPKKSSAARSVASSTPGTKASKAKKERAAPVKLPAPNPPPAFTPSTTTPLELEPIDDDAAFNASKLTLTPGFLATKRKAESNDNDGEEKPRAAKRNQTYKEPLSDLEDEDDAFEKPPPRANRGRSNGGRFVKKPAAPKGRNARKKK